MGQLFGFLCTGCGNVFHSEKGITVGWSGDTYATVVCAEHGMGGADTSVNLDGGGDWASLEKRETFPCRTCGAESPPWDQKSCPECGLETLTETGYISYD